MTKRRTTQTPRKNLLITGEEIPDEIDWDLLDQLADEEEGQVRPMMDNEGNPFQKERFQEKTKMPQSSPEPLNEQGLQTIFEMMDKAKKKGPKHSEHWHFKVPQGTPKS